MARLRFRPRPSGGSARKRRVMPQPTEATGLSGAARRVNRLVAVVALIGAFGTVALAVALTPGAQQTATVANAYQGTAAVSEAATEPVVPEPVVPEPVVVEIASPPEPVIEAAFRLIKKAQELIDMRGHKGEHPRFGATDVCPLIPISGISMEELVPFAHKLAERVGNELKIPVSLVSIVVAFVTSCSVGLIFGYLPASRASRSQAPWCSVHPSPTTGKPLSPKSIAITHSNCRALFDHPRLKTDDAIRKLAAKGLHRASLQRHSVPIGGGVKAGETRKRLRRGLACPPRPPVVNIPPPHAPGESAAAAVGWAPISAVNCGAGRAGS